MNTWKPCRRTLYNMVYKMYSQERSHAITDHSGAKYEGTVAKMRCAFSSDVMG